MEARVASVSSNILLPGSTLIRTMRRPYRESCGPPYASFDLSENAEMYEHMAITPTDSVQLVAVHLEGSLRDGTPLPPE